VTPLKPHSAGSDFPPLTGIRDARISSRQDRSHPQPIRQARPSTLPSVDRRRWNLLHCRLHVEHQSIKRRTIKGIHARKGYEPMGRRFQAGCSPIVSRLMIRTRTTANHKPPSQSSRRIQVPIPEPPRSHGGRTPYSELISAPNGRPQLAQISMRLNDPNLPILRFLLRQHQ
jgi:hypothetical protein